MGLYTNTSETVRYDDAEFMVRPSKQSSESMVLTDIGSAVMVQMKRTKNILINPDTVREDMLPWLNGLSRWEGVPVNAADLATGLLGVREMIDAKRRATPEVGSKDETQAVFSRGEAIRDELLGEGLSVEEVRQRLAQRLHEVTDEIAATREEINVETAQFNDAFAVDGVGSLYEVMCLNGGELIVPAVQKIRDRVQFDIRKSPSTYTAVVHERMPVFVDSVQASVASGGSIWSRS